MTKTKYYDQLLGAHSTQELVEIHNNGLNGLPFCYWKYIEVVSAFSIRFTTVLFPFSHSLLSYRPFCLSVHLCTFLYLFCL